MKNHKRIVEIMVILAFMLFMTVGATVTLTKPKETYSYFENRSLHQKPVLTWNTFLDGQYFQSLESYFADHAALRTSLLKVETLADIHLVKRPVVNDVVVTEEVLLPKLSYSFFDEASVSREVVDFTKRLEKFDASVEAYGGTFYYVGVPCQYAYYEDQYPWYLENRAAYTETVMTAFRQEMDQRNLNFIDMGRVMKDLGRPKYFGSLVDNHYGLKGAFATYEEIVTRTNQETPYDLELLTDEAVDLLALPNEYIGSRERKLLNQLQFEEPLQVASFKEPIEFTRMDNGVEKQASMYQMPHSDFEPVLYGLYMGGDIAETVIQTQRPDLPSVLIYGDSFTNAVEVFAYYSFDEMRSIDLRHYKAMALEDYIEVYKPDIVLCIRDYEAIILKEGNGDILSH